MRALVARNRWLVLVLIALLGATACAAARSRPFETATTVAALLRNTWGATTGFRTFEYSCTRLDDHGQLFTCLARDRTGLVKLASFDVVCDRSRCRFTAYLAYSS